MSDGDRNDQVPECLRQYLCKATIVPKDPQRAPQSVWETLHSGIRGSKLVLIPSVGQVIDIEAAERFNTEVKTFSRAQSQDAPRGCGKDVEPALGAPRSLPCSLQAEAEPGADSCRRRRSLRKPGRRGRGYRLHRP